MSGGCLKGVWKVPGWCLEDIYGKSKWYPHLASSRRSDPTCLVWRLSGGCLVGVWWVSGGCLEGVLRVSGESLKGVWKVPGRCLEGIYGMSEW